MEKSKTLPNTWKAPLSQLLKQASEPGKPPRVAIIGIGNQMRCDDAAGLLVARSLSQRDCAAKTNLLILEAGHAPENSTGELRKFAPDLVVLVDAAEMGEEPGTVQLIPEELIDGMSASTHSLPLSLLTRYLVLELNCKIILLGIQPKSNDVGETISEEVSQAIDEFIQGLMETIAPIQ